MELILALREVSRTSFLVHIWTGCLDDDEFTHDEHVILFGYPENVEMEN